ncbi:MAG: EamA family transporter [archaeon]
MQRNEPSGYLQLIVFSILAGSVGVFVRMIESMTAYSILFFRAAIGVLFILMIILLKKKTGELKLVYPAKTFLVGLFQGLSILLYFYAVLNTTIANSVFLLYTAPVFSVILANSILKEEIRRETLVGLTLTLFGIVLILDPTNFSINSRDTLGVLAGIGSGIFYSAMAITAKTVSKKASGYYLAFWQYLVISALFSFSLINQSIEVVSMNFPFLLYLGVFTCGIAFILFMEGVRKVKAQKVFIVTALEPLVATFLAFFVIKEVPTALTLGGAFFILLGVYAVVQKNSKPNFQVSS